MLYAIAIIKAALWRLIGDERAQDTFEYVLIIGAVVVAVILAVATPVGGAIIDAILDGVCAAIDTLPNIDMAGVDCSPGPVVP